MIMLQLSSKSRHKSRKNSERDLHHLLSADAPPELRRPVEEHRQQLLAVMVCLGTGGSSSGSRHRHRREDETRLLRAAPAPPPPPSRPRHVRWVSRTGPPGAETRD